MSFVIARQKHIQKKITTNLEKDQKLLEIRTTIHRDFDRFLHEKKCSTGTKFDERKLKLELNQLIFQNLCKEKTLQSLKMKVFSSSSHQRSASVIFLNTNLETRAQELQVEIQEVIKNTERESEETELLQKISLREKTVIVIDT